MMMMTTTTTTMISPRLFFCVANESEEMSYISTSFRVNRRSAHMRARTHAYTHPLLSLPSPPPPARPSLPCCCVSSCGIFPNGPSRRERRTSAAFVRGARISRGNNCRIISLFRSKFNQSRAENGEREKRSVAVSPRRRHAAGVTDRSVYLLPVFFFHVPFLPRKAFADGGFPRRKRDASETICRCFFFFWTRAALSISFCNTVFQIR